ncbi:hypothetical protein ACW9HH_36435 [Nocardia gipuzkoensis]
MNDDRTEDSSEDASVPDDLSSLLTPEMGQRAEDALREAQQALLHSVTAMIEAMDQIPEEHHSAFDAVLNDLGEAAQKQKAAREAQEEVRALLSAKLDVVEEWLRRFKGNTTG